MCVACKVWFDFFKKEKKIKKKSKKRAWFVKLVGSLVNGDVVGVERARM